MSISLNTNELQTLIQQIIDALLPTFHQRAEAQTKASADTRPLLTVAEVAKRLRCSPKTVTKYCQSGELNASKHGGRVWKISEAALKTFRQAHGGR